MTNQQPKLHKYAEWIVCGVFTTFLLQQGFGQTQVAASNAEQQRVGTVQVAGVTNHDGYVGSASCSPCHMGIYKQFSRTSMGRSISRVTPDLLQTFPTSANVFDEKLDRHFEVHAKDGKLYQSEYQTDAEGKEIFRDTRELEWIIGAGTNGFGALLQRDNFLFQAPLSFYSKPGIWDPSPGYEFGDYGFNRPILAGCISCHSGRPRPVAAANGRFESSPFEQVPIGCENCHGPGAVHIQAMDSDDSDEKDKGHFIVNPGKLSLDMANNICMSCHQIGDERVFKEGKSYQDFRPGTPLDSVLSILIVPPTRENPPHADHLEHYYSMTLSKCYRVSAGRMGCITCHNPHIEPSREEAPTYFNAKCMTCHTDQSCKVPLANRALSKPANNCIGCHMPKRDLQMISHSSATSHRILARPDEGFPDDTFQQTTPALPDLIHLNPAPGKKADEVESLTLLQAYGELSGSKPEYIASYLKVLAQLEQTAPDNALVQAALGHKDLKEGKLQQAVDHLQRAVQLGPPQATTYADLSEAVTKMGQTQEGLTLLQKATELDPFNPVLQRTLVLRLINLKQYPNALLAMEHYLQIFPQDSYMRKMLDLAKGGVPQK